MAYKIDNTNVISNVGVFSSSLQSDFSISSTLEYLQIPESMDVLNYAVGERIVISNLTSFSIGYHYSNDYVIVTQANASVGYKSLGVGDNLVVVGDPTNNTLNTNAGLAFVYDYEGNLKYTLQPTTNVRANVYFGRSVSIKNNLIAISSSESNTGSINPGTIYVYYANGTLKSRTYRPANPQITATNLLGFTGVLIDGYRILATDLYAMSSNSALSNVGAIHLFATDNSHIFTANQQVDIGAQDYFGAAASYSSGIIAVGSPGYESQIGSFPLNDGLITGISIYGDLVYRYDQGTSSPSQIGTYIASGGGYVATAGYFTNTVQILNNQGQLVQSLGLPSLYSPYFTDSYTSGPISFKPTTSTLQIYNNKLYVAASNTILSYSLPQTHDNYYSLVINNKERYY